MSSRLSGDDERDEEKKEYGGASSWDDSEMRGVYAKAHIPPHSLLVSIPRRCLITVEMGQATPIGQAIMHADLDLDAPKHIFLMIYLLWDRKVNGPSSFFHPYYEVLPKTLFNMPIFWSEQELAGLQGSYLLHQITDRSQAIAEDYRAICKIAPELKQLATLDEFKWARMCVCSRNFGLQVDGHRTSALVPHADMLNHYRPRETKWTFDEDRQAFTITSLQHISAGNQVFDSYGQKCNHRFLLNYGFAVEDNREIDGYCPNEVPLELFIPPDDELFNDKLEFWTRGEISRGISGQLAPRILEHLCDKEQLQALTSPVVKRIRVCVSNNENTRLLFSLLRALACDSTELKALASPVETGQSLLRTRSERTEGITTSFEASGNRSLERSLFPISTLYHRSCRDIRHPISLRNERAAMRLLLKVIDRHLSLYPTTLSQDVADLCDEATFPRFSNRRHAKIQVRGEKEVLHHFGQWARTSLDVLDVLEEELQEERGGVEVSASGRVSLAEERPGFEYIIRQMEDNDNVHHTILRYCADILGSLRREEFKVIRRQRALLVEKRRSRSTQRKT